MYFVVTRLLESMTFVTEVMTFSNKQPPVNLQILDTYIYVFLHQKR